MLRSTQETSYATQEISDFEVQMSKEAQSSNIKFFAFGL
jgi:hypothetical protein